MMQMCVCVCVCVCVWERERAHAQLASHVQLFATPWTVTHWTPLSMRCPRQEYWGGLPLPSPGDLPNPGIEPVFPASAGRFFTTESPVKTVTPLGGRYFVYHTEQSSFWISLNPHDHTGRKGQLTPPALQMGKLRCRQENQWLTCHTQWMTDREIQTQLPNYKPTVLSNATISILVVKPQHLGTSLAV